MELPLLPAVLNWHTFPRRSAVGRRTASEMHLQTLSASQIVQRGSDDARGSGAIRNPREAIRSWEARNCRGAFSESVAAQAHSTVATLRHYF